MSHVQGIGSATTWVDGTGDASQICPNATVKDKNTPLALEDEVEGGPTPIFCR